MSHPPRPWTSRNAPSRSSRGRRLQLFAAIVAFATAALLTAGALPAQALPARAASVGSTAAPVSPAATSQFHGVNWADPRDNFVNDAVVPSGLSSSDDYATTYAKATSILTGFKNNLGANTVRMPVNPSSVGTAWWNSYMGAINAASDLGFKVFLAYWEGASSENGTVDNVTTWDSMWDTITGEYNGNTNIYFEPMNEPHGYSATDWDNLVASWLSRYPSVPKAQVVVSGTGYDDNVTAPCADSRLNGTYLALHDYAFWATRSYSAWVSQIKGAIGSCASRTVMDEFGVTMNNYENYDDPSTPDNNTAFIQAAAATADSLGIGSVYWPGLRSGDGYSMESLHGTGTNLYLANVNPTGVHRLWYAWGRGAGAASSPATTRVVGTDSNRCLDVPGSGHANGTQVELYDCNGGSNQAWTLGPDGEMKVYDATTCLDAAGQGTTNGTKVGISTCNGGENQKWSVNADGTITNVHAGLCLDAINGARTNNTLIDLWACTGGANQQWVRK
jgi:Ricin-type beta-trefoil lectin domain/Cellulase (glycosyl hydrolase family 5)